MSREVNPRKAAVIGCGFVGSATAFTLMQSRLFSELVLLDVNMEKADGEAKDIAHGIPFAGQMKIYAGTYDDAADAAIIIITAGANQKPGETRLDLVQKNTAIYQSIIPEIVCPLLPEAGNLLPVQQYPDNSNRRYISLPETLCPPYF